MEGSPQELLRPWRGQVKNIHVEVTVQPGLVPTATGRMVLTACWESPGRSQKGLKVQPGFCGCSLNSPFIIGGIELEGLKSFPAPQVVDSWLLHTFGKDIKCLCVTQWQAYPGIRLQGSRHRRDTSQVGLTLCSVRQNGLCPAKENHTLGTPSLRLSTGHFRPASLGFGPGSPFSIG